MPGPLSLVDVARSGDTLTITMRANYDLSRVLVRLTAEGAVAGVPEWERQTWRAGETHAWDYKLLRDVTTATLTWDLFQEGHPKVGSQEIHVPPRPPTPTPVPEPTLAPRLVVTNATLDGTQARLSLTNVGDAAARNVVVALEDAEQTRIGSPLTRLLAALAAGATEQVDFVLARERTEVVVALEQANATTRTSVTLRRLDATEGNGSALPVNVSLSTDLPFREVDLGGSADFAVQVRNLGAPALVQLRVDGLPSGYSARFFVGGSAVPSLYLDRNQTRQATLTVTVPTSEAEVDRTADFTVLASVNGTQAGRLDMGVAVRGVGQLQVGSDEGEAPLAPGGIATFHVSVRNTGTAPLFNVELDSRRPYGWTVRTEPRRIDRLDPGDSSAVTVEVRAPDVIGGGRYAVDVAATAGDATSRYASLAMNVEEPEQGGGWVWGLLLVALAGILGFAAWAKWRG